MKYPKQKHLSVDEQPELVARFQKGEQVAIDKLVEENKAFVVSMAKKFSSNHLSLDELVNFGLAGIVLAAHKFDFTKGVGFLTYARHYIYSQIQQGIVVSTPCTITIPRQVYDSIIKIKNLTLDGLSDIEISKQLDIKLDKIPKLRGIGKGESMSGVVCENEGGTVLLEDILACDKNNIEQYFDCDILNEVENFLDEQGGIEKVIYSHYNGLFGYGEMTYKELGEITGKSIVTVMKLEKEISRKLIEKFGKEL